MGHSPLKRRAGKRRPKPRAGHDSESIICGHCARPFKAITYTHLVHLHDYDPEHPVEEYKAVFQLTVAVSDDSRKTRSQSRIEMYERRGLHWTRKRVIREIRDRASRHKPLNHGAFHQTNSNLPNAGIRLFGSWKNAVTAAGIRYDAVRLRRPWSRKTILREIRHMRRARLPLNSSAVRKRDPGLLGSAEKRFGGWGKALRAAGVDEKKVRKHRRWTRRLVLESLRRLGRPARIPELQKTDSGLVIAALKEFGSWPRAIKAAGYEYVKPVRLLLWPRGRVLRLIRRRVKSGLSVQDKVVIREDRKLLAAGRRRFGTWRAAVAQAGVPYPGRQRWPKDRVLEEIRSRAHSGLGVNPGAMNRSQPGLFDAGKRIFGSWPQALVAARIRT